MAKLKPEEVLHVGDFPELDVLGASKVGIHTCWLSDGRRKYPNGLPEPNYKIKDLREVLRVVL